MDNLVRRCGGALVAVLTVGALAACSSDSSGQGPTTSATGDGSLAAAEHGESLTKPQAGALEQHVQSTPGDLNAREQLVGYYFIAQTIPQRPGPGVDQDAPVKARDKHLLWLIQNSPGLQLMSSDPLGVVQPQPDTAGYAAARDAWVRQAVTSASPRVKGNAGIFFAQTDDSRAIDLLTAAEAGDGQNPTWPGALGDLYTQRAKNAVLGSKASQQAAASAVTELEQARNLGGSSTRDPRLSQLAKLSVVAGEYDKAVQYAMVLLATFKATPDQSPLSVGGPIHDGNMVLGQVALRKGDRQGAEEYLLKAGATPGSPTLDQFGPNFSLARDLLLVGSKGVVLKYVDEVAKFWSDPKLTTWRAAIALGKIPDFGDNLWN